ncbi:MAG: hypothetical protein AB3A66_00995 [Nodularia sp. CChRGM 3473]
MSSTTWQLLEQEALCASCSKTPIHQTEKLADLRLHEHNFRSLADKTRCFSLDMEIFNWFGVLEVARVL